MLILKRLRPHCKIIKEKGATYPPKDGFLILITQSIHSITQMHV